MLEELTTFCPGGRITDIECKTINDIEYYSSGETLTCTVETGLICLNTDNDPIGCNDYQIRYKCSCGRKCPVFVLPILEFIINCL